MRVKIGREVTLMIGLMMGTTVSATPRFDSSSWRDDECFKEVGRGLRIEASHVDKYVKAGSLDDCEKSCNIAFFACKSFSYSGYHTREPENCLLSREDSYNLDLDDKRDFFQDSDFIFYEKTAGRDCEYEVDHKIYHSSNNCYDLVKTRERINSRYIIRGKVLRTKDRKECEYECDRERECRGFNYRYKTLGYDQYRDNCELSSRDASDRYDFEFDDDFDFYEQVTDSRNCHGGSSWGSTTNTWTSTTTRYYGSGSYNSRDECFRLAMTEKTLENRIVRESLDVRDIAECELECTRSRHYTCRSFAFRYGHHDNWNNKNCFLTDQEYRDLSNYDLVEDRSSDYYERRLYDRECSADAGQDAGDVTVSGLRCSYDRCREERQGGYFFCETDSSGAWDYCCRPHEICAFSEGYEMKWCYVGIEGRDQWRPCTGQGPGREYLKADIPSIVDYINGSSVGNSTDIQVLDLNDIA